MVYLKLLTNKIDETINFYTRKIGLFKSIGANRLVCEKGVDFIIDLVEAEEPVKVDFGITFKKLSITSKLQEAGLDYLLEGNLAGQHLYIDDPNGNQLWLTTQSGEIT
jgi:hypothetical protein